MYTLFGAKGIGVGVCRSRAHAGRHRIPQRRGGVMGSPQVQGSTNSRRVNPLCQIPTLQLPDGSVLTESAAILIHLGLRASRQRIASRGRLGARASHSRPRLHRGELLRRDRHHRLSGTLVRGPRRGHEQAHQGRDHATAAPSVGSFRRHVSRPAVPGRTAHRRARPARRGGLEMVGVAQTSRGKATGVQRTAGAHRSEPRVAPIFARHWPPPDALDSPLSSRGTPMPVEIGYFTLCVPDVNKGAALLWRRVRLDVRPVPSVASLPPHQQHDAARAGSSATTRKVWCASVLSRRRHPRRRGQGARARRQGGRRSRNPESGWAACATTTRACPSTSGNRRPGSDATFAVLVMTAASVTLSATSSALLVASRDLARRRLRAGALRPVPSGFAALDAALPGRGWPQGALTELLLEREGIGEIRSTLPALARVQARRARRACGSRRRTRLMRRRSRRPASISRGLSSCTAASAEGRAVGLRPGAARARMRRRVRVAAHRTTSARCAGCRSRPREGRTWGVLWRRPGQRGSAAAAPLRLALAPHADGQLAVRVLKRRGADVAAAGADRCRQAGVSRSPPPSRCRRAVANIPCRAWRQARTDSRSNRNGDGPSLPPLRDHGVQQRVGQPPAADRVRAAVAGRFRRAAHELLSFAQGHAQPQPHRRLVLRRRARSASSAASRSNTEAGSLLRTGGAVRRVPRSCTPRSATSIAAWSTACAALTEAQLELPVAVQRQQGRHARDASRDSSRISSSTRSTIAGRRTRCSPEPASSRRSSTSSSAPTRPTCAHRNSRNWAIRRWRIWDAAP